MQLSLLFSGQGTQETGMGKEIYEESAVAREIFDRAGDEIKRICFEESQEELNKTINAQVAIFVLSMAKYEDFIRKDNRDVSAVAGFSLGEYSALCAARVFTFEQGLELVKKRAKLMQDVADKTPQGMLAILGMETVDVLKVVENNRQNNVLQAVNFNCPGQIVVAGEIVALDRLESELKERNIRNVRLPVNIAGHSDLMKNVAVALKSEISKMKLNEPEIPVISNMTGRPYNFNMIKETLAEQVANPVHWQKSMRYLLDIGIDDFVEIGVGDTLMRFLKRIKRADSVV